jgi:hypothetical protein
MRTGSRIGTEGASARWLGRNPEGWLGESLNVLHRFLLCASLAIVRRITWKVSFGSSAADLSISEIVRCRIPAFAPLREQAYRGTPVAGHF